MLEISVRMRFKDGVIQVENTAEPGKVKITVCTPVDSADYYIVDAEQLIEALERAK